MIPLIVVLCIIGVVMLLSKFLPDILRAIPAVIGLIILAILIGGIVLIIYIIYYDSTIDSIWIKYKKKYYGKISRNSS